MIGELLDHLKEAEAQQQDNNRDLAERLQELEESRRDAYMDHAERNRDLQEQIVEIKNEIRRLSDESAHVPSEGGEADATEEEGVASNSAGATGDRVDDS